MDSAIQVCNNCSMPSLGMKKCGGCKALRYCSIECQKAHWKIHKRVCAQIQEQHSILESRGVKTTKSERYADYEQLRSKIQNPKTGHVYILDVDKDHLYIMDIRKYKQREEFISLYTHTLGTTPHLLREWLKDKWDFVGCVIQGDRSRIYPIVLDTYNHPDRVNTA